MGKRRERLGAQQETKGGQALARVKGLAAGLAPFATAWTRAKGLFDYKNTEQALREALPHPDFYIALCVFAFAGLLTFAITALMMLEFSYLANFMAETLADATGNAQPAVTLADALPAIGVNFVLAVPFGVLFTIAIAATAFSILRLTGGKGTLAAHMYTSGVVELAFAMSTVVAFFAPLPCLQIVAGIAIIVLELYLLVYVLAKAYVAVHGVGFGHALVVALVLFIGRLLVMALIANAVSALAGLPQVQFTTGA